MQKKAILITGAAGGLGQALVHMAVSLPGIDKVIATDIKEEITGTFAEWQSKVIPFVMDATSDKSIALVRKKLKEQNIVVRYLINNAGIFMFHPVSELTEEMINRIFRVNALSSVQTVNHFLNDLITVKGRVVQISSCAVKFPTMFQSYPATKIAMEALSVSMRQELDLHGIKLILLRSGAIDTGLIKGMNNLDYPAEKSRYNIYFKKFMENAEGDVGMPAAPGSVAEVVRKALMSKRPKYVYTVNRNRTIRIFSLFPQRMQDFLIKKTVQ